MCINRDCQRLQEAQVPYDFKLKTIIPASAQEIYEAWLDSLAHSEMTQATASMSDEVGDDVSAWDGYITGRNVELIPGERIVQSWRTSEFSDEHEDSIVTVVLEDVDGGTLLTLVHANVPDGQTSYEQGGWQKHYFAPMQAYFSKTGQAAVGAKAVRSKTEPKRPAAKTKPKRAAPKAEKTTKAKQARKAAAKQKSKRVASAKAGPKRSKIKKKKSARRRG
jgi:uncharacterized protein YndB with AHSA1/START domain